MGGKQIHSLHNKCSSYILYATYILHIIRYVYRIELVRKEAVPQMHSLLLATRIDWYNTGINHHHYPYN